MSVPRGLYAGSAGNVCTADAAAYADEPSDDLVITIGQPAVTSWIRNQLHRHRATPGLFPRGRTSDVLTVAVPARTGRLKE
jgi:hypothetical protein